MQLVRAGPKFLPGNVNSTVPKFREHYLGVQRGQVGVEKIAGQDLEALAVYIKKIPPEGILDGRRHGDYSNYRLFTS